MLFKLTIHNGLPSFEAEFKLIWSFQTITDDNLFTNYINVANRLILKIKDLARR